MRVSQAAEREEVAVIERACLFEIPIDVLRRRTSEKWRAFPPEVLPSFVAETDFAVPPAVRDAIERAVETGDTGYAWPGELPGAFADFASKAYGWSIAADRVFQVPDVMSGVAQALLALTPQGSGVVINPPAYAPFFEVLRTIGRTQVDVPLQRGENGRWDLDFASLERAFANGAKGYLLCSPHNPVGRVWSARDVQRICELAVHYGVAVVSDEIHSPITPAGATFVPLLGEAPQGLRCACVMSASKAWNIAGLKCAVLVAGSEDVRETLHRHLHAIPTEIEARVGHLGVQASIAAFRNADAWLPELRAYLDGNRTLLMQLLHEQLPQVRCSPPEATYLAWIDCSALTIHEAPARYFRERGRVALEPGAKFGTGGEHYVRLNFGTSRAILREIVERMSAALLR